MLIRLLAAGTRLPGWVNAGYDEYAGRMGPEVRLELLEIPVTPRGRNADVARARAEEGRRMLAAIPPRAYVTALDVEGRAMTTGQRAQWLDARRRDGRDVALLVGGPDGIDAACMERADSRWSLSPLSLLRSMIYESHGLNLLKFYRHFFGNE